VRKDPPLDQLILQLYARALEGGNLSTLLKRAFAQHELKPAQRTATVRTLFGLFHHERRIDLALSEAGLKGTPHEHLRGRLMAWRMLSGERTTLQAKNALPGPKWAAVEHINEHIAAEPDAARRLGLRHSLEDFLAKALLEEYGEDAEALAKSLAQAAPLALRANTLLTKRESLLSELLDADLAARKSDLAPQGLVLEEFSNPYALPAFAEGRFEVQDEGSQLVAELAAPPVQGLTIDYCAGAGGKTLAMAALLNNRGRLVAVDTHAKRLEELKRRARRAGAHNIQPVLLEDTDPEAPWPAELEAYRGKAARVVVDAPCSGLGVLRRKPEIRAKLRAGDVKRLTKLQLALATRAADLLAPGGRLLYATCSLLAAENENIIAALLETGGWEVLPPKAVFGKERAEKLTSADGRFLKLLPHQHGCDGFFAAVLVRRAKSE